MSEQFVQYKKSVKERLDNADLLVAKVIHENTLLSQQLEAKNEELQYLTTKLAKQRKLADGLDARLTKQEETIEIVKDLFEHMCGVRVHKSYEDDTGLWFDVSQGSDHAVMDYKLGFVKADSDHGHIRTNGPGDDDDDDNDNDNDNDTTDSSNHSGSGTQVIYVPLLKQRTSDELKKLQDQLPNYLFDTLSFPLKSLNQFYTKMTRSLNKTER